MDIVSKSIIKSDIISTKLPALRLHCIEASVVLTHSNEDFWHLAQPIIEQKTMMRLEDIKKMPEISSTREAYKLMGKEPSRYRPSAEALHRRIIRGAGLYRINNVVDIINYISLKSAFSIGGYDADKTDYQITADTGKKGDIYESIGRGYLNIEHMPVLRDQNGAFGTPTSDSERSKIDFQTKNILLVFWDFNRHTGIETTLDECKWLLKSYAHATKLFVHNF